MKIDSALILANTKEKGKPNTVSPRRPFDAKNKSKLNMVSALCPFDAENRNMDTVSERRPSDAKDMCKQNIDPIGGTQTQKTRAN